MWKWLGLAGLAGVAATGVVIARDQRQRTQMTPDDVRARLHERLAEGSGRAGAPATVREVLGVFTTAGRLLLRHWPALLTLSFLGAGLRNGAVYAAIKLSEYHGQLGLLMLVLAPLGYLLPVVAMLTVCRRSLPSLQVVEELVEVAPTERRPLRLLDVAVSVLVPFMAVYSSYGLLEQDLFRFRNVAAADVFTRTTLSINPEDLDGAGRLGIYTVHVALLIVVGAWLVRFALGKVERTLHLRVLAYLGALVEVYYTAQLAGQLVVLKANGLPWVEDRVAARWVRSWYDAVVDFLGPVAGAFEAAVHAIEAALGSLDAVVVVPVGWLTLAAVVLGYKLLEDDAQPVATERKGMASALKADLKERWSSLFGGIRLLAQGGLAPMLVFSLVFLLVTRIPARRARGLPPGRRPEVLRHLGRPRPPSRPPSGSRCRWR